MKTKPHACMKFLNEINSECIKGKILWLIYLRFLLKVCYMLCFADLIKGGGEGVQISRELLYDDGLQCPGTGYFLFLSENKIIYYFVNRLLSVHALCMRKACSQKELIITNLDCYQF